MDEAELIPSVGVRRPYLPRDEMLIAAWYSHLSGL